MSTHEQKEKLLEIQELDTNIIGLKKEIEGLGDKHQLEELASDLQGSKDLLAAKEQEIEETKHRQDKLDGELDLLSTKIKTEEEKMFSGSIMNPKELSNIQAEILALRKKRDEMETEDLELMEVIDTIRIEVNRLASLTEELRKGEKAALGEYEKELAQKESELTGLQEKRDGLKAALDKEIVEQYDKLLKGKGGLAVVRVDQGRHCGGCHIELSRTQIDKFQHEEGIFRCEYCRRILIQ